MIDIWNMTTATLANDGDIVVRINNWWQHFKGETLPKNIRLIVDTDGGEVIVEGRLLTQLIFKIVGKQNFKKAYSKQNGSHYKVIR